jgi:peptidoglycan/xylan/chitin deacetylase (PgdA/CDA1 family)
MATTDEIRRRRRIRHLQEQRRRAAIRRRNMLFCAAIASAVIGAVVGSGAGGGGGAAEQVSLARGGLGPPPDTGDLRPSKDPVPILMYHVIDSPPSSAQLPELYVDPKTFDRQMEAVRRQGYSGVSLNQVYDAWFKGGELPAKPVVVSFDDGYRSQYVYARPELRKLAWPGVLSAIAGRIGQPNAELSDAMVKRMINDGWELDSHTINHVDVTKASGAELQREVGGSRRMLQRRFHQPVNFFCYPSGRYDRQAITAVRGAGYLGATTTREGLASKDDMYTLKRIRVDGTDGVNGLERKLKRAGA